ncbi:MAG: tryptophan synthase subunit alpha [Spirochaetaceae bacterium]|jgi:tryptophan synthase alpha chain|nr:tryptophan synthase subunit alpha [Spirochaetaceae bacterium]
MNRIAKAFEKGKVFIGFVTGGDPGIEKTEEFILEMIRAGAGLVEIGIPFSDPIAEGSVIQAANIRALSAGATVEKIFALAARVRQKTEIPLAFLTYLNPVFQYGYDAFFRRCRDSGVDGIIIPDLPFEEQGEVRPSSAKYGVDLISLVAPTSEARIREIVRTATGFLYLVSSLGVTGVRGEITTDLASMIASAREAGPAAGPSGVKLPIAVGFGIHTPAQATEIARIADGVIVGSAIVKIIEEHGEAAGPYIYEYVRRMCGAIK